MRCLVSFSTNLRERANLGLGALQLLLGREMVAGEISTLYIAQWKFWLPQVDQPNFFGLAKKLD